MKVWFDRCGSTERCFGNAGRPARHVGDGAVFGRGEGRQDGCRGACGMKFGNIGALYALDAIKAAGLKPTARIHFQSVIEEEGTGVPVLGTLRDCVALNER